MWPRVCPPSSRQFDVLTAASGHWLDECRPSNEVLGMYLDPSNLPRLANSQRHAKRSKVDVISYRLRTPEDQFSCSRANDGEGHNLPPPTVRAGGLYRALLGLPSCIRFASTPEILLLQVPLDKVWLPSERGKAVSILGNTISTPHSPSPV